MNRFHSLHRKNSENFRILLLFIFICVLIAFLGLQLYWYHNPDIDIDVAVSDSDTKQSVVNDYTCEKIGFYGEFTLSIFEDGRFSYIEGGASSHIGYGNWELDGNKLTLFDVGIGEENAIKIVFEYKDKQLIYNKAESDSFIYTELEDGTRFIPTDSMTEEQKLSLEMQLEQQLEDVKQRMITAKEAEEDRFNAKLYAVVRQNFIGEDFEGFVCFDARETIEDEQMPIKLWVETRDKQILWETELGLPHTGWNSYYMYEEDGKNYLIQYYPDDSQGMIAFTFNIFTVNANGELLETGTFEANSKEEIQNFNNNVMPYLNRAELLVGTIGGDINVKD